MSRYLVYVVKRAALTIPAAGAAFYVYSQNKYDELKEKFDRFNALGQSQTESFLTFIKRMRSNRASKIMEKGISESNPENNLNFEDPIDEINYSNESKLRQRLEDISLEVIQLHKKYKSQITTLENENKELKKEIYQNVQSNKSSKLVKRKNLVQQYGEIIDMLSDIGGSSDYTNTLPRVVVVGDQSSGKTSVLEYIAKARIFPRGFGEMMTRSPVMLTMGEGPHHVASFRNENRKYNLKSEKDLSELRQEIESKMNECKKSGKTVSSDVISITMTGPDLPRMVLVDLPGIINTVTSDLSADAKDSITSMAKSYMSNPNSIILCVQDGSIDAERSLVTELVSSIDPAGSRTICVLTKLDVAEQNNVKMERIQQLLSGKLFPMKALSYYAVIAGTGNPNSTISEISQYEEDFFKQSSLFRDGTIRPNQATSQNLIAAVSETFWRMVKSSVEHEADSLRSRLFALETEWRHNFPNMRELDRDELFEKARGDIIDDVIAFSNTHSREWDALIAQTLWKTFIPYVFREIYLKNALTSSTLGFQTQVEIVLRRWLNTKLTDQSIESAKNVMFERLLEFLSRDHSQYDGTTYNEIFKPLRNALYEDCTQTFNWNENNAKNLKVIQEGILSDDSVNDRAEWDQACSFMESIVKDQAKEVQVSYNNMLGPSSLSQWFTWSYLTPEQLINQKISQHLTKLIGHRETNTPQLTSSEIATVIQNLHNDGVTIKPEVIHAIWDHVYLIDFYKLTVDGIHDCRRYFRKNECSKHKLCCNDVVLFFKIHNLLQQTATTLRQQILTLEARRLENCLKNILEKFSEDENKKKQVLTGKQVELAVEMKKLSQVKSRLDKFIESLLREQNF